MLDFVILHYGDHHVTDTCIRSIQKMDRQEEIRMVIVDNEINKPAELREKLKKRYEKISNLSVVTITEDGGFSYANNAGYRYARDTDHADWICVINNDIEFTQADYYARLEKIYEETHAHILSPNVIRKSSGEHQSPMDTRIRTDEEAAYTVQMNSRALKLYPIAYPALFLYQQMQDKKRIEQKSADAAFYAERQEAIVPFGACLIFSPAFTAAEEKPFQPETHFFYEEYLLTLRCQKQDYRIVYDPSVKVFHESGTATRKSMGSEYKRMRFMMQETKKAAEIYLQELKRTE